MTKRFFKWSKRISGGWKKSQAGPRRRERERERERERGRQRHKEIVRPIANIMNS